MSIASEINRISGNIADALDEVSNKGVTVPSGSNSDDLPSLIRQISGGDGYVWQDQNGYVHLSDEQGTQTIIDALTVSGAGTSTAPTGHAYSPVTVPSGSASTPATSVTANPTISVSSGGLITATASATKSVTPSVSAGWVASGTAGTITVSGSNTSQLSTEAGKTVTPTTSEQTAVASGKYTTGAIKVAAMPSGTAGTPTATKGTVSNHSVTVTPSVTNTTGYITGGTKTGTAVTVTASELASGDKAITGSGTVDVVGYSTVSVPAGLAGQPSISLQSITNHVAELLPYARNTRGYITGVTTVGASYYISASQLTSGTKSITENGTGIDVTNYSSVDVNVPASGGATKKQINFIDYDGRMLYSYTADEWANVTSLPSNPSHEDEGLTAQGWNWTKAQIDDQLNVSLDDNIWVGQMYATDDGYTRIHVNLPEGRVHPYLGIGLSGSVDIDWGDYTGTDLLTGSSTSTVIYADHEYDYGGEFVITINVISGSFVFFGTSSSSHILKKSDNTTANVNRVYTNAVQKIELGDGAGIGGDAFHYCTSLKSITIPNTVTSIGANAFASCYALKSITIPSGITSIGSYTFSGCYSLATVSIPYSLTSVGVYAFDYCRSLEEISFPYALTSVGTDAFNYCTSLKRVGFFTEVENLWYNVFANCSSLEYITTREFLLTINDNAFDGCNSLPFFYIPWSVTTIGNYAFRNCYSLSYIEIPDTVESVGTGAFSGCYGVSYYYFWSETPPTLGANAFEYIQSDCKIYVPPTSVTAYKTATNWSAYASYIEANPW